MFFEVIELALSGPRDFRQAVFPVAIWRKAFHTHVQELWQCDDQTRPLRICFRGERISACCHREIILRLDQTTRTYTAAGVHCGPTPPEWTELGAKEKIVVSNGEDVVVGGLMKFCGRPWTMGLAIKFPDETELRLWKDRITRAIYCWGNLSLPTFD